MTVPYTPNHAIGSGSWDEYDPAIQVMADAYAWSALRYLTGQRVGNDPVLLRPCTARCWSETWTPTIRDGEWYNRACGHSPDDCSCASLAKIIMPGEVAEILGVWEDGNVLVEGTDYQALNGNRELVRMGGSDWLSCQDFTAEYFDVGALAVHYVPGVHPGDMGLLAAGVLANEFALAIQGKKCMLPAAITSLSRNGISLDYQEGYFPNNVTGLMVVDTYVHSLNPTGLRQPSLVWSPDVRQGKTSPAQVGD